jgi:hypothetical protein
MTNLTGYTFQFVTPAVLQSDDHHCLVIYEDAYGSLDFHAVDPSHYSGGVIVFPAEDEWQRIFPSRNNQRDEIRERLSSYLKSKENSHLVPHTLSDDVLTPQQATYIVEYRNRRALAEARVQSRPPIGRMRRFWDSTGMQIAFTTVMLLLILLGLLGAYELAWKRN